MSLAIYLFGVCAVVTVMLSSYFLGEKSSNHAKNHPYESGIKAFGSSRVRFFPHYFLMAILFVIFDIESVFLYLYASSVREVSWWGFFLALFFVSTLLLALAYAFSMGVFNLTSRSAKSEELS